MNKKIKEKFEEKVIDLNELIAYQVLTPNEARVKYMKLINKALKAQREEIGEGYKKWALTHTATWETDNLVHDLMGNPDKPVILAKGKHLKEGKI
jgi:hypothetical protein